MRFEPDDRERRREQDFERLGTRTPKCRLCPESDPGALTGTYPDILCVEHEAASRGRTTMQAQHPSGWHNDPSFTYPTPGNDHAVWDEAKGDWPERTLRNPHGSPLLAAAGAVRSVLDWFRAIIERVLGWVPAFLEELDARLEARLGITWWVVLGIEGGPR
jgi:hypothetical protein